MCECWKAADGTAEQCLREDRWRWYASYSYFSSRTQSITMLRYHSKNQKQLRPPRECKAMSRIDRRRIESNSRLLGLDAVCRLIRNCCYANASERGGSLHGDGDLKIPPQYTLVSNGHGVSEQHGIGVCFAIKYYALSFLFSLYTYIRDSSGRAIYHSRNFVKGFASSVPELQGALE